MTKEQIKVNQRIKTGGKHLGTIQSIDLIKKRCLVQWDMFIGDSVSDESFEVILGCDVYIPDDLS